MSVRRSAVGAALLLVALAGCGSDDGSEDGAAGSPPAPPPAAQAAVGDPAAGEAVVRANGCSACHDPDGRDMAGPTWQGLAGSEVTLSDGTTVVADAEYLRRSITDPRAELVEGYRPLMPEVDLTDEEVDHVVAYLETL